MGVLSSLRYAVLYSVIGMVLLVAVGCPLDWVGGPIPNASTSLLPAALERYHRTFGRYPDDLDGLVRRGILAAIPDPPRRPFAVDYPYEYLVDLDTDFYCLTYYDMPCFGGVGSGSGVAYHYISHLGAWDASAMGRVRLLAESTLDRAGSRYRKDPSRENLILFIKKIQEHYASGNLSMQNISMAIGSGDSVVIEGSPGARYDVDGSAYCFLLKERQLPQEGRAETVIAEILELDRSSTPPRWRSMFKLGREGQNTN